jgi:hypothetical protein
MTCLSHEAGRAISVVEFAEVVETSFPALT